MNARRLTWLFVCALVVLAARTFAYALSSPNALALQLQHSAGGPRLVVLAVSMPLVGIAIAAGLVWLASVAVRERHVVAGGATPAPIHVTRLAGSALGLFAASSAVFTLFESYLHWRAGLGFHGWHCLVGPVHRDAIPFLAALSVIAAATIESVRHLWAWMRRTLAQLAMRATRFVSSQRRDSFVTLVFTGRRSSAWNARGPPHAASPC